MIRRSDESANTAFIDNGIDIVLRESALQPRKIPGLSMNLLGSFFVPKHTKFRVTLDSFGDKKWAGNEIYLMDCLNDYTVTEGGCHIFFNANGIHNQLTGYDRPADKHSDTIYKNFYATINGKYSLMAKTTISHEPTNMNYWHVELKVLLENEELLPGQTAKWIKGVGEQIISNLIIGNAMPSLPKSEKIHSTYYKNP